MNKDLPEPIKKIFKNPDPLIWQGDWLDVLEKLLSDEKMTWVWKVLIESIEDRYDKTINMSLEQYLKWESKAFVAQIIKLSNKTNNYKDFNVFFQKYFSNKNIKIPDGVIEIAYKVTNEN